MRMLAGLLSGLLAIVTVCAKDGVNIGAGLNCIEDILQGLQPNPALDGARCWPRKQFAHAARRECGENNNVTKLDFWMCFTRNEPEYFSSARFTCCGEEIIENPVKNEVKLVEHYVTVERVVNQILSDFKLFSDSYKKATNHSFPSYMQFALSVDLKLKRNELRCSYKDPGKFYFRNDVAIFHLSEMATCLLAERNDLIANELLRLMQEFFINSDNLENYEFSYDPLFDTFDVESALRKNRDLAHLIELYGYYKVLGFEVHIRNEYARVLKETTIKLGDMEIDYVHLPGGHKKLFRKYAIHVLKIVAQF